MIKKAKETSFAFSLKSIQVDNQADIDPVYPIILKPTDLNTVTETQSVQKSAQGQESIVVPEDVF